MFKQHLWLLPALLSLLFPACGGEEKAIEVQSIAISQPSAEMEIGETITLKATVSPSNASFDGMTWTSTNPKVASVSDSGIVTAISEGNTTITVMAGGKTASCLVEVIKSASVPDIIVTTYDPTDVGIYYATCGGDVVTNIQGLTLSALGICWSEIPHPTINDISVSTDRVSECFVFTIKSLKPNTTYYVRAFALRGTQPYYGEEKQFRTLEYEGINVITKEVTDVTSSSAQVIGNAVSDGGIPIRTRGFCWSTSNPPTVEDSYVIDSFWGSGIGEFRSIIQGLTPETTYYVRSFAENSGGVYYGQVLSFTTAAEYIPPITVDGDFSDWAKLNANDIATAKCDPKATKTALKLVKVYADSVYVFVYFEWDKSQISHVPDVEHVPFHIFINTDGDASTGGYGYLFSDACTDIMLEGFLYPDGRSVGSYVPLVCEWAGDTNGDGWDWADLGIFNNLTTGAGVEGKYELRIDRKLMPKKLADTFSIGFEIEQSWTSVGLLPNAAASEDNPYGIAPSLQVITIE